MRQIAPVRGFLPLIQHQDVLDASPVFGFRLGNAPWRESCATGSMLTGLFLLYMRELKERQLTSPGQLVSSTNPVPECAQ